MIVATRTLFLTSDGKSQPFDVRIYQPEPQGRAWACNYEIDWPGKKRASSGFGVDSVQAILSTMLKIGLELYSSDQHSAGTLVFDKSGNGYGFPVPKELRGLLVGDDARFDGD